MNNPFFTVIIPLYNKENHILCSVNSVLNQSCNDFELIIVNDGCTDDSIQRIEKIKCDPRVEIITQKNKGRCIARNTGIENSKGKWICFLDADDEFLEDHFKTLKKLISNNNQRNVFCTKEQLGNRILPSGKTKFNHEGFNVSFKDFLRSNPISLNQCTFRSESIIKFPEERFPISEDWYYLRRITYKETITGINKVTVSVNDHVNRTMHTSSVNEIVKWNLYGAHKIIEDLNLKSRFQKPILSNVHLLCANFFLNRKGAKDLGYIHIKKSFKYFPYNLHILLLKACFKLIFK